MAGIIKSAIGSDQLTKNILHQEPSEAFNREISIVVNSSQAYSNNLPYCSYCHCYWDSSLNHKKIKIHETTETILIPPKEDYVYITKHDEPDLIRRIIKNVFKEYDHTDEKLLSYYSIKLLILYFDVNFILNYLENSLLLNHILKSQDINQYQYIIELLYFKCSKDLSIEQHNKSFELVKILANAITNLPKSSSAELTLYYKFYTLLSYYSSTNFYSVVNILYRMLNNQNSNNFFNLQFEEQLTEGNCLFFIQNNYLDLLLNLATQENILNNSEHYTSLSFNLLKKSLTHIKQTLADNNTKVSYIYISILLKRIIHFLKEADQEKILALIFDDATISNSFKQYLFVTIAYCAVPRIINNRLYSMDDQAIINRMKLDIEQCSQQFRQINIAYDMSDFTKSEQGKIITEIKLEKYNLHNTPQCFSTINQITEDAIELSQITEIIYGNKDGFKLTNFHLINALSSYPSSKVFNFVSTNAFVDNILFSQNLEDYNNLIDLLFIKIKNSTRHEQFEADVVINIVQKMLTALNKIENCNSVIQIYGKIYQLLTACLYIDANQVKALLEIIADEGNLNDRFTFQQDDNNIVINTYFDLIEAISKNYTMPNRDSTNILIKCFIDYARDDLKKINNITVKQALFFAKRIVSVISNLNVDIQSDIIKCLLTDTNISQKFKTIFVVWLEANNIKIPTTIFSIPDKTKERMLNILYKTLDLTVAQIDINKQFLTPTEN